MVGKYFVRYSFGSDAQHEVGTLELTSNHTVRGLVFAPNTTKWSFKPPSTIELYVGDKEKDEVRWSGLFSLFSDKNVTMEGTIQWKGKQGSFIATRIGGV